MPHYIHECYATVSALCNWKRKYSLNRISILDWLRKESNTIFTMTKNCKKENTKLLQPNNNLLILFTFKCHRKYSSINNFRLGIRFCNWCMFHIPVLYISHWHVRSLSLCPRFRKIWKSHENRFFGNDRKNRRAFGSPTRIPK